MSVGQVRVDVDLLLDPGGEVRDVAVNPGSERFTEAHAAPRRQAEQRPATAALLTHQRAAAVTLNTRTHIHALNTHTLRNCVGSVLHAGLYTNSAVGADVTMQESTVPAS